MITTYGAARPQRARQFFHAFYRWQISLAADGETHGFLLEERQKH